MTHLIWVVIGAVVGAVVGGGMGASKSCESGGCPIASGPLRGILMGALFGGLFAFLVAGGGGACPFVPRRGGASAENAAQASSLPALTGDTFSAAVAEGVVLVDFWASWCGPCQRQLPVLEALAEEVKGQFAIVKVNVDEEKELAKAHGIRLLPTLVFFRDGQPVRTLTGMQSAEALRQAYADLDGGDS